MKKCKWLAAYIGMLLFSWILYSCGSIQKPGRQASGIKQDQAVEAAATDTADRQSAAIKASSRELLQLLQSGNLEAFSRWIDPEKGVRFSPYAYVDTADDIRFLPNEFLAALRSDTTINWGRYDGTGAPILLSVQEYFQKFVYDLDYVSKGQLVVNRFLGSGNSLNNLTQVYPDAPFSESYFPGADPKLKGMDWSCLRLVFRQVGDRYYLIAIVHDEWTI